MKKMLVRFMGRLAALSLAIVCMIQFGGIAYADTIGPHQPPPYVPRPASCTVYSIPRYQVFNMAAPEIVNGTVQSDASVEMWGNNSCSYAKASFYLQTKVCGFWGCHWHNEAESALDLLPYSGVEEAPLSMGCRSGTNSYRSVVVILWTQADAEESPSGSYIPYLEGKTAEYDSDVIKTAC